jgi:hypothetical protein
MLVWIILLGIGERVTFPGLESWLIVTVLDLLLGTTLLSASVSRKG